MSEAAAGAGSSSAAAAAAGGQAGGAAGSKRKRQDLTLEQKVQVLDMWKVHKGSQASFRAMLKRAPEAGGRGWDIGAGTLCQWINKDKEIRAAAAQSSLREGAKRARTAAHPKLEEALMQWHAQVRAQLTGCEHSVL